jgi:Flp pilus assembly pilin Flp
MAEKLLIALRNRKQSGASMLEYALLAALIAICAIGGIRYFGNIMDASFQDIANTLSGGVAVGSARAGVGAHVASNW